MDRNTKTARTLRHLLFAGGCMMPRLVTTVGLVAAFALCADAGAAQTITAFKTGEKTTGMTKQCFYDALGSEYTRTIRSVALCPLSIRVTRRPGVDPT